MIEAAHDAGPRREPVPAGGAWLRVLAENLLPRHLRRGQELHYAGTLVLALQEVEEQAQRAGSRVDTRRAFQEVGVDARSLEGGVEGRGLGATAKQNADLAIGQMAVGGRFADHSCDFDGFEMLA